MSSSVLHIILFEVIRTELELIHGSLRRKAMHVLLITVHDTAAFPYAVFEYAFFFREQIEIIGACIGRRECHGAIAGEYDKFVVTKL